MQPRFYFRPQWLTQCIFVGQWKSIDLYLWDSQSQRGVYFYAVVAETSTRIHHSINCPTMQPDGINGSAIAIEGKPYLEEFKEAIQYYMRYPSIRCFRAAASRLTSQ